MITLSKKRNRMIILADFAGHLLRKSQFDSLQFSIPEPLVEVIRCSSLSIYSLRQIVKVVRIIKLVITYSKLSFEYNSFLIGIFHSFCCTRLSLRAQDDEEILLRTAHKNKNSAECKLTQDYHIKVRHFCRKSDIYVEDLQYLPQFMFKALKFCFAAKKIITGSKCSQMIAKTAQEVARVASVTLGPMGRNVVIENDKHEPRITKDGVTVVKHIEYEDRLQDAVCTLIKKSVNSTNRFAGDGTTTSSLLIGELLKHCRKFLQVGYTPREIKEGLKIGRDLSLEFLKMAAQPVTNADDYFKVAMIATKGDKELSRLISEAVSKAELIKVERTERTQSFVQYLTGVKMVAGIPHPEFKNVGDKVELNYPLVLLDTKGITSIEQIVNVLELAKKARKQIFIVSTKISDSVLSTLIYNKRKNIVEAFPVILHDYGTIAQDYIKQLSKVTGAAVFDRYGPCSLTEISYQHLGKASKVEVDEIETVLYGKSDSTCTNAVIYAGGATEAVALQIYDKIVDALNSVQTSKKHGVIAGGGVTFWRMAQMLELYEGQFAIGVKILALALKEPRRALVKALPNYYKALGGSSWEGYNFKSGKLEDMFEAGVIDSAGVGESVLLDSVSLASVLLDIQVSIVRDSLNIQSNKEADEIQKGIRM